MPPWGAFASAGFRSAAAGAQARTIAGMYAERTAFASRRNKGLREDGFLTFCGDTRIIILSTHCDHRVSPAQPALALTISIRPTASGAESCAPDASLLRFSGAAASTLLGTVANARFLLPEVGGTGTAKTRQQSATSCAI